MYTQEQKIRHWNSIKDKLQNEIAFTFCNDYDKPQSNFYHIQAEINNKFLIVALCVLDRDEPFGFEISLKENAFSTYNIPCDFDFKNINDDFLNNIEHTEQKIKELSELKDKITDVQNNMREFAIKKYIKNEDIKKAKLNLIQIELYLEDILSKSKFL